MYHPVRNCSMPSGKQKLRSNHPAAAGEPVGSVSFALSPEKLILKASESYPPLRSRVDTFLPVKQKFLMNLLL